MSIKIPQLASGYYLVRPELLALHITGGPQFYAGCAQVFLESDGDLGPAETVSIPGYVQKSDPGAAWNIYYGMDNNDYPVPGPAVAQLKSGVAKSSISASQAEGQKPEGCILENGNFCAFEVPDYDTENECWAAQQNCWDQQAVCWDSIQPTGGEGCDVLTKRCDALNAACNAKQWTGPPNKGKMLNHQASTLSKIPAPSSTNGGGTVQQATSVKKDEVKTSATPTPSVVQHEVEQPAPSPSQENEDTDAQPAPSSSTPTPSNKGKEEEPAPAPTSAPEKGPEDIHIATEIVYVTDVKWMTVWQK